MKKSIIKLLIMFITLYRWFISPLLPRGCRYLPTCSNYALEALNTHNLSVAIWLVIKRLSRCHPFAGHGFDPVPLNLFKSSKHRT